MDISLPSVHDLIGSKKGVRKKINRTKRKSSTDIGGYTEFNTSDNKIARSAGFRKEYKRPRRHI